MNKNYYRILWGCLAVVVIAGGIYYFAGRDKTPVPSTTTPQQTEQAAHQVIVNQTPALQEAVEEREYQYDSSEQQETETVSAQQQQPLESAAVVKEEVKPQTEKQQTEEQQNTQQASIFESEPLFVMPLAGNIVMDYSADHAIYDATLDQYRTNDHISIGAKKGESVKASEDGTVESVKTDDERGITVVLNHGNGWQTTYSQLQEDVVVKEGDKVKKGQEIGFVAEPTKYSVALGEHVDFSIAKDGVTVDPKNTVVE
ncbi:MAG: M23 family metallopeptidase [Firmicutes bacterium]|jgi:murein DD-endopeptidase MepM/ murein hydrolase activator NlpD|nr:M23 family metallopeptidase [Bacillota bacterium]